MSNPGRKTDQAHEAPDLCVLICKCAHSGKGPTPHISQTRLFLPNAAPGRDIRLRHEGKKQECPEDHQMQKPKEHVRPARAERQDAGGKRHHHQGHVARIEA